MDGLQISTLTKVLSFIQYLFLLNISILFFLCLVTFILLRGWNKDVVLWNLGMLPLGVITSESRTKFPFVADSYSDLLFVCVF